MIEVKEILEESGWYDDVVKILRDIITLNCSYNQTYPLHIPFVDEGGETIWRIPYIKVQQEANLLLSVIINESDRDLSANDLFNLLNYLESELEIEMHNYTNHLMHRNKNAVALEKLQLEEMRCFAFLEWLVQSINDPNYNIPLTWYSDEMYKKNLGS